MTEQYTGYYHHHHHSGGGGIIGLGLGALIGYAVARQVYRSGQSRQGTYVTQAYSPTININQRVTVDFNSYSAFAIDMQPGDRLNIAIDVVAGTPIDIFLLDEGNYQNYARGQDFSFYKDFSALNTRRMSITINAVNPGRYIVVIDNTFHPKGVATPDLSINDGRVDVALTFTGPRAPTRVA